jgi:hypothetical protein
LVVNVLRAEKELAKIYDADKKYCPETIGSVVIQKPCFEYAQAFHNKLNGMVEEQMRKAILAIGSAWYTAWVDAGQPDLSNLQTLVSDFDATKDEVKADSIIKNGGKMLGRPED